MAFQLRIDGSSFRDSKNREVTLHGINVAGEAKLPTRPYQPSHEPKGFFDGDHVSFVGRPFSTDDAPRHFARLRRWGYNTMRYVFTWEAIEHAGPGKYDEDFVQHTIATLHLAKSYGFYVIMDPHQDVWSRFTGGSGAPMWTVYACGLDPKKFAVTEAALVQNVWPDPKSFPKMIWATNYNRLACQAIFTMFWAGGDFTPLAVIGGVNIQDFLQDHLIAACKHLAVRIKEAGDLDKTTVIGWESMNEPNRGLVGLQDICKIPSEQKLQKGTSPTAWQAILTGSGRSSEIDTWDFGGMGPYKSGSALVDPQGQTAWLSKDYDDAKYGWKRDPKWQLGECIWAQHGVWNPSTDSVQKKDYFAKYPKTGKEIDYEFFSNTYFMPFYRKYKAAIREVFPETIMFCQPPVLEIPPSLQGTSDDDPNMVYAPHWYDGLTLMTKKWNRVWNIDVFGVLRGRYLTPAFAIKLGETAIRNCFRDQLSAIKKEGTDYMGVHPCVFTEFGIPYDMDDGYAYKTGDFTSQIHAMDSNHFAMEGNKMNFCLWVYTAENCHQWGDEWNGEDLSIVSEDDRILPSSTFSDTDRGSPSYSESQLLGSEGSVRKQARTSMRAEQPNAVGSLSSRLDDDGPNFRAAEAFVRPTPIATHGDITSFGFDLRNCVFKMAAIASTATDEKSPTEIFLPEYHFPKDFSQVEVSGGRWTITSDIIGDAEIQILRWWHGAGEQTLKVTGVKRKLGKALGREEEENYLDQCREKSCRIM